VTSLVELNKIIGLDDTENSVLLTLLDGRCALVDKKSRHVVVEILVDSFYKWMDFPNPVTDEEEEIKDDIRTCFVKMKNFYKKILTLKGNVLVTIC